ncbi:MAG: hypothetical protein JST54_07365 [Deltaproteobacteria bacterium]|nr:hypothetical protein [Deltaproteobacteria bacterium]
MKTFDELIDAFCQRRIAELERELESAQGTPAASIAQARLHRWKSLTPNERTGLGRQLQETGKLS